MEGVRFDPGDVARRWFAAYAAQDFEGAYAMLDPAVEVQILGVTSLATSLDEVRAMDEQMLAGVTSYMPELRTVATAGDTAVVERVDHFVRNGERISVPICGAIQCGPDGRIVSVREYFDMAAAAAFFAPG